MVHRCINISCCDDIYIGVLMWTLRYLGHICHLPSQSCKYSHFLHIPHLNNHKKGLQTLKSMDGTVQHSQCCRHRIVIPTIVTAATVCMHELKLEWVNNPCNLIYHYCWTLTLPSSHLDPPYPCEQVQCPGVTQTPPFSHGGLQIAGCRSYTPFVTSCRNPSTCKLRNMLL